MTIPNRPLVLIVMGPMGCGKTTVGRLLADALAWPFIDADDLHPPANVAKMQQGIALNDDDRKPWLEALRAEIAAWLTAGRGGILACSALKQTYRDRLGVDQQTVRTVYLKGSFTLLQTRIEARRNHYMSPDLLQSQLDTLEAPAGGITVDITPTPATIVARIINQLQKDEETSMPATTRGDRFIPFRKTDLIEMGLRQGPLPEENAGGLRELGRLLEALLHFEYHHLLEKLKDAYAPFNPDADTRRLQAWNDETLHDHQADFVREMGTLLDAANFEKITESDLKEALSEASLFKIRLSVDFNDFEDVLFFRRGESIRKETLVTWGGLRRRTLTFTNYDRVVVYIKFKPKAYFDARKRRDLPYKPGATLIKLFRNVPKADLEMLFPNSEVRMQTIDKLIIGIPAAVSGVVILVTKLGASLALLASLLAFWLGLRETTVEINQKHLVALGLGLGTLAGFLFKQFSKFKNRKIRFMKALAENLYFKNLDNNAGVLHHLIDAAEEEEFKEALLAYLFLAATPEGLTRSGLDKVVEDWLATGWDCRIDFEVDDALAKLARWGLLRHDGNRLRVLAPVDAKAQLDRIWDDFFKYTPSA